MEGAGHLRRLAVLLFLLPTLGCSYFGARARDFGDIIRVEANVGYGLQAHANVGEFVHLGIGSRAYYSFGWVYGQFDSQWQVDDDIPLSIVYNLIDPGGESLHSLNIEKGERIAKHRCYILFPGELYHGDLSKSAVHYWDIEVGFLAGVIGLEIGFSFGELLDFFLGWFGVDIADDDDPKERERRTLWIWEDREQAETKP